MRSRKMRSGSSGAFERVSITKKAAISAGRGGQEPDRRAGRPAVLRRAGHRVDEQHQPARDRGGAGEVEVAMPSSARLSRSRNRADRDHEHADRDVDEEDPRPAERARQRAAEQHARRAAATRGRAPDAEREVALAALPEGRGQDRERGRREQRRAEALHGAEGDQRALRPGEPVQQRADREQRQPGHEQAPPSEQVGEPAAEQQHAAEEDRVGGDHPLQALLREVQVGPDRRQRDVHDRDVEHDHELRRDDHRQREPAAAIWCPTCCVCQNFGVIRLLPSIVDELHDNRAQRLRATLIP